jgi:arylsulfatase A-like enzyme
MRRLGVLVLVLSTSCAAPAPRASARPNIVLILADDMGFSDLGCYGSEIATPNLDRLAERGMRFTQFYNGARCCPTRASLLTGLHPHQAGVGHMVEDRGNPAYQGYLNKRCATIAEVLRPAGYRTCMSGKWHVGAAQGRWPVDRGFDRYFGLLSGGSNYFELDRGRLMLKDAEPWTPPADQPYYMTDAFTDAAVGFVEESTSPFFLYLAYTAPHWPLQAPAEEVEKYRDLYKKGWDAVRAERIRRQAGLVPGTPSPRDAGVPPWENEKNRELEASKFAVYAAMVDRMDQGIGRVLEALRKKGVEDDTLVVFLSDNGASAEEYADKVTPKILPGPRESFHTCGPRWANVSNTPFRSYKHWVHEGGIATPFIASWPGKIAKNSWTREPAQLVDLMATFVDASGAAYPARALPMEGRSLLPALRGGSLDERPLYWEHEGNRAIRLGRWKLVARHKGAWELYDLEVDRTETRDLSTGEPDRVRRMAVLWDSWAARVGVRPFDEIVPPR